MSIQTELTRITNAKAAVKAAIEGKGVTVPDGTLLDGMAPLIESIEAGGVGVQSDWNQNDETQPDYVKNRPFYTGGPVETVLVEESTVSFAEDRGLYIARFPSTFEATVGETYKVSWDGTVYECACADFSGRTTIGNLSIAGAGSDTGEPFLMVVHNGQGIDIVTAETSASHTFSISGLVPEVVKIDKKYLVQPDWNQNDSTQPDYVKNRPFYTGNPVETVLVEESTVSFSFSENEGLYMGELKSTFSATVGETYKVSWDGTAYECTCIDFSGMTTIGNLSIAGAGSDTGEPFVMLVDNGQGIVIGAADTSASHTFSISGFVPEVVKIDEKYLPDTIATKSEVKAAQTTANNAQTTANNAQTTANNAKSEALDLAARMFGHTSVVDNAFYYDKTLSITSLPACIESIGVRAFAGCKNLALASLPSGLTSIGDEAFFQCTKLALTSLPSGLTSIGDEAFFQCINLALTSLPSGLTSIGNGAFSGCINLALTSLPSGITSIGMRAFSGCFKLAFTSLPSGITSIGMNAFQGCTGLTSITFTGTPTSIGSNAFSGCTNLTTINVPWAEGEVANAPWGATNATINYNYTGA